MTIEIPDDAKIGIILYETADGHRPGGVPIGEPNMMDTKRLLLTALLNQHAAETAAIVRDILAAIQTGRIVTP